jgi:Flp pilus assembly protein protease CpaA
VALLSILLGGVMAVGVLLYKKRAFDFFLRMQLFVSSLFVQEMKAQKPEIDKNLQMPFGIPMAVAALLLAWGVPVWPI